jgi:hypothetical protein
MYTNRNSVKRHSIIAVMFEEDKKAFNCIFTPNIIGLYNKVFAIGKVVINPN